jgi:four helix bundle protein
MSVEELKNRFKKFAILVARLIQELPKNTINSAYSNQLIRCSSSSAANYRAACRGKSRADFINKLKIVEEEIDESVFFLELILEFNGEKVSQIEPLIKEANELLAITVASLKTSRSNEK